MSVHVADVVRRQMRVLHGRAHDAKRAVAVFGGQRDVKRIARHSVADNFRENRGVALCRVLQDSRIKMPAPSPTTKPSRSASKGRLACSGSSLRVDSALMEANPPTPIGVMVASVPPQIIMSASPRSIILKESPIA